MNWNRHRTPQHGGSAPATPGFTAVAPEWLVSYGAADAAPAIPAAESTLGSHPCVALSSAQVLPEWINRNLAGNRFAANGDNPLNFVSHPTGSVQVAPFPVSPSGGKPGRAGSPHAAKCGRLPPQEGFQAAPLEPPLCIPRFAREEGRWPGRDRFRYPPMGSAPP